jgi:hypothetical protein
VSLLKSLAARSGLLGVLQAAWKRDIRETVTPLKGELRGLVSEIERLREAIERSTAATADVQRTAEQTRLVLRLNQRQQHDVARLAEVLEPAKVTRWVREAVARAPLQMTPFPHIVVEPLLPDATYRMLVRAIPPAAFFGARDPIKQNLRIPIEFAPELSERVWRFVDDTLAREAIRPAVLDAFREPLLQHCARLFGESLRDRAAQLPQAVSGGRVMLRRPGYFLAPHRDPKRAMLTCLLYLARPGDSEEYGTGLYSVDDDREPSYVETYYPGEHGHATELVRMVPYRPNSMVAFLNCGGAHGAQIPPDAPPGLERYAFQFYIGPEASALDALVEELPPERKQMWQRKKQRA